MAEVLGRVTGGSPDVPRGADVDHTIRVPMRWLEQGETLSVELPRNLRCAACGGGGCDACGRAGAITLRPKGESAPPLEVTLPRLTPESIRARPAIVLRIPGQGGPPEPGSDGVRGLLLLKVTPSDEPDPSVRVVPSVRPPEGHDARPQLSTRERLQVALALALAAAFFLLYLSLR